MTATFKRPAWLEKACTGYSDLGKVTCWFEGKHFAVVKLPGGMVWGGRGFKQNYNPTRYELLKKGHSFSQGRTVIEGGRVGKTKAALMLNIVKAADDLEDLILQLQPKKES